MDYQHGQPMSMRSHAWMTYQENEEPKEEPRMNSCSKCLVGFVKWFCIVVFGSLIIFLLGSILIREGQIRSLLSEINKTEHKEADNFLKSTDKAESPPLFPFNRERYRWRVENCSQRICNKVGYEKPPLVVISLDGFAHDYLKRNIVKSLQHLADCGATAERVLPVFPSKTFPIHYTIATGLYPESHGIVDNVIYDPTLSAEPITMKMAKADEFFKAEPIWHTYENHTGKPAKNMMWIGSNIDRFKAQDSQDFLLAVPMKLEFDKIIDSLLLPGEKRPGLVMAYVVNPDNDGHFQRSSEDVDYELEVIDRNLDYLLQRLHDEKILDCINIVILSDHGMQIIPNKIKFNDSIDMSTAISVGSVVGRFHLKNTTALSADEAMAPYKCKKGHEYTIFKTENVPTRLHYSNRLVGDVILRAKAGTYFYYPNEVLYPDSYSADHGYDNHLESMHTVFFARGPSFKANVTVPAFEITEYYNLFCDLLGIVPNSNNGTVGLLDELLLAPPQRKHQKPIEMMPCSDSANETKLFDCNGTCNEESKKSLLEALNECRKQLKSTDDSMVLSKNYCRKDYCNKIVYKHKMGRNVILQENVSAKELPKAANCTLISFNESKCSNTSIAAGKVRKSLSVKESTDFATLDSIIRVWPSGFIKTFIDPLNEMIDFYYKRFGRAISISGVAHDRNHDGLADQEKRGEPTHFYRILLTCNGWGWNNDGMRCRTFKDTEVLAFIFPVIDEDFNCLESTELLFDYTARIKDVELIADFEFNLPGITPTELNWLRTRVNTILW